MKMLLSPGRAPSFHSHSKMAPHLKVWTTDLVQLLDFTDKTQKTQLSASGDKANYKAGSGLWEEGRRHLQANRPFPF